MKPAAYKNWQPWYQQIYDALDDRHYRETVDNIKLYCSLNNIDPSERLAAFDKSNSKHKWWMMYNTLTRFDRK